MRRELLYFSEEDNKYYAFFVDFRANDTFYFVVGVWFWFLICWAEKPAVQQMLARNGEQLTTTFGI